MGVQGSKQQASPNGETSKATAASMAQELVANNPLVVFSKSYCPFCTRVNKLLRSVGALPKVMELDIDADGPQLQAALTEWTRQRTVPNVFIGGKHIGGCDDTVALHSQGKLIPLLKDAGALA